MGDIGYAYVKLESGDICRFPKANLLIYVGKCLNHLTAYV